MIIEHSFREKKGVQIKRIELKIFHGGEGMKFDKEPKMLQ